ncbi:hypothetical protein H7J07_06125 [Mycobacterium koreense]|uniref:Uncharacterized protein n=1 Tax=Mycolicibacillus koreensis TaxID=1069220 RepID=A0A7I7SCT8_9MYCO|nr:hypothetical protein [Mycolicibacillus koreensis]MCV7247804.1 hypothetical protein [Mycolicibacillus koreensis]OSC34680.1 hypothetical protein B8W67_05380 [Mycolicibacillus koreensis]BBY54191.1 hypothetical protein MKOR_14420 [Mycolicibacillus koreensis]
MNQDTGITVYAFIRPGTPSSAGPAVVTQIVDLYRFGAIGPGSKVWCNLDIPNALWVLSDRSSFLRIVDVPTAGWVRLTKNSVAWGRVAIETSRNPSHCFHTNDMPMALQPNDTVTVAFRNTDPKKMRSQFGGANHAMRDYVAEHGSMRAIDLKMGTDQTKQLRAVPTEFDINHAGIRGLDLMAATTGPAMHRIIRNNIEAFTTTILTDEFRDIQAAQKRISEITEMITDPIVDRISKLPDVGPFDDDDEDENEAAAAIQAS